MLRGFFVLFGSFLISSKILLSFPQVRGDQSSEEPDWCLKCHGNTAPSSSSNAKGHTPPRLPEQFSMTWLMYEFASDTRPPHANIPQPAQVIHGSTYYDWSKKSMTEIYQERCIDIFPEGRDYPCQFTSVQDKTYLIRFSKDDMAKPASCCVWRKSAFWAPRPDVLQNMSFDQDLVSAGTKTRWWILDIALPGPFGYGLDATTHTPSAFWFPVFSGWVQQVFKDFKREAPDAKYFELPEICKGDVGVCG